MLNMPILGDGQCMLFFQSYLSMLFMNAFKSKYLESDLFEIHTRTRTRETHPRRCNLSSFIRLAEREMKIDESTMGKHPRRSEFQFHRY
jgi:hypothetical protein